LWNVLINKWKGFMYKLVLLLGLGLIIYWMLASFATNMGL
jgi:hypothetical protein